MSASDARSDILSAEARLHYEEAREQQRLFAHYAGQLERARSQAILRRYLPPAPAIVLDIGGGPGAYAFWLAALGYTVHLIDAMPLHVEQAAATARHSAAAPETIVVGDARRVPHADESADAALLMGPLYHLTDRGERLSALREALRCLRPGGIVSAVGISRYASALDGLAQSMLWDPAFAAIVEQDLIDGQHRNPDNHPHYFTTTFFHRPDELCAELVEAGFQVEALVAVEGPAWAIAGLADAWENDLRRAALLKLLRRLEAEPSLLGASAHIMAIGRKPPPRAADTYLPAALGPAAATPPAPPGAPMTLAPASAAPWPVTPASGAAAGGAALDPMGAADAPAVNALEAAPDAAAGMARAAPAASIFDAGGALTHEFLLARGACCGSGCRNCPYR